MVNLSLEQIGVFDVTLILILAILFLYGTCFLVWNTFANSCRGHRLNLFNNTLFNKLDISFLSLISVCLIAIAGPLFVQKITLSINFIKNELKVFDRAIVTSMVGQLSGCIILYFLWISNKKIFTGINFHKIGPSKLLSFSLKTYAIAMPIVVLSSLLWQVILAYFNIKSTSQPIIELLLMAKFSMPMLILLGIFVAIVAPITEEIIFRGIIYRFLASKLSNSYALILSSTLFAALHIHLSSFLPLAILGALLGWLYFRSGNIFTNIALHAIFNLVNYILLIRCCLYA